MLTSLYPYGINGICDFGSPIGSFTILPLFDVERIAVFMVAGEREACEAWIEEVDVTSAKMVKKVIFERFLTQKHTMEVREDF